MLIHDLRLALRQMARSPGLTLIIVLTLAIGIGANAAMFSTINAALLRSLPYDEPDRLVLGRKTWGGELAGPVSGYDYYDYREQSSSFEVLAALAGFTIPTTITGAEEPERIDVGFVTYDLFPMLGVEPVAGRGFSEEEAAPEGDRVALLSYGYAQRRFGSASAAVGQTMTVRTIPFTVIGVMPAGFRFLVDADSWILDYRDGPISNARRWHNLLVVGRLKPGVSLWEVQAEVDVISAALAEQYPESNQGKALNLTRLHDYMVEGIRTSLLLLMVTVVLVLLIACGNVAGILLARGQVRAPETAIRTSLGATRPQLVRQHLTESMLLAVAGVVGVLLAYLFQAVLLRLLPMGQLAVGGSGIDASVLLFALIASVLTGLIFGTVPAVRGASVDPSSQLRSGTRISDGRRGTRLRSGLVVLQVGFSIVLLIGAGLLIRSLSEQMRVDLGFNAENLLTGEIELGAEDYPDDEQQLLFLTSLVDEIRALPGVTGVGLINQLPIRNPWNDIYVWPEGEPPTSSEDQRSAYMRVVLSGYFETMQIPIRMGRDMRDNDVADAPRVIVLGEEMAREFFPDESPLGKRVVVDMGELVTHEVVGVVGDVRMTDTRSDPYRTMYFSYHQVVMNPARIAIRTAGDPTALVEPVRRLVREQGRNVLFAEPATMASIVDDSLADFRVVTSSLGLFSAIAVLLTAIGLYGVLAYFVSQRLNEIGVRKALGATEMGLVALILRKGFLLVGIGVVAGLAGAVAAARLIRQLLFGVQPIDIGSYLTAAVFLTLVALLACLLPAMRAARIDPSRALRVE
ncbi:ABC transporter permease [Gemmatimonadota bacterium]